MAANKIVTVGPVALTTTLTTNIFNPGTTTGGVAMPADSGNLFGIIRKVAITNKSASAATVSLWLGATGANAAGTEYLFQSFSIPANSYVDWYGIARMDVADFLVGGSGTATAITFEAEGEVGVV